MRLIGLIVLVLMGVFACCSNLKAESFLPENNLNLEDQMLSPGEVTQTDFNNIINYIQSMYAPIVKKMGANLVIKGDWNDSTVNAYASTNGKTWNVQMFGGLARRPEVTFDGFAMVICHELGHHLAGFPTVNGWYGSASNEGNSDYWALMVCAKKFFKGYAEEYTPVNDYAKKKCDKFYTDSHDLYVCYRSMNAGWSLGNLLASLGGDRINFETPDPTVVYQTNGSHPAAQCRLDTMVAGSICRSNWRDDFVPNSEKDAYTVSCQYGEASRSACWYARRIN
jgi:hypothetical protein